MNIIKTIVWLQPGPRTCIMAWVHGNEIGAQKLLYYLSEHTTIEYGEVIFVVASPQSIELNVRYVDHNLNRLFGQARVEWYESTIITDLEPLLDSCDYLLDLHNTIRSQTQPFLITEHMDYASCFDVGYVVSGLDAMHPWASDGYMDHIGWVWLCLECGHIHDDSLCFVDSVMQFLATIWHNHIDQSIMYQPQKLHAQWVYHSLTDSFILAREFADFDLVKDWEVIGYDGGQIVTADGDCYLLFAKSSTMVGWECFVTAVEVS